MSIFESPLDRARRALLNARARAEHSPSAENLRDLEGARARVDELLDTLTPERGGADHPPRSAPGEGEG